MRKVPTTNVRARGPVQSHSFISGELLEPGSGVGSESDESYSPNSRLAFSFMISGLTSSRIAIFSKSAIHRSGVSSG